MTILGLEVRAPKSGSGSSHMPALKEAFRAVGSGSPVQPTSKTSPYLCRDWIGDAGSSALRKRLAVTTTAYFCEMVLGSYCRVGYVVMKVLVNDKTAVL